MILFLWSVSKWSIQGTYLIDTFLYVVIKKDTPHNTEYGYVTGHMLATMYFDQGRV